MPTGLDHLLALTLAVFFPIRAATFGYRRLVLAPEPRVFQVRGALYRQALAIQWGLAALVGAIWIARGRTADSLGLVVSWSPQFLGMTAVTVIAIGLLMVQNRRGQRDPEVLEAVLKKLGHVERMLPRTPAELGMFKALSVTAGFCEELLYRGFLMWYVTHWLPLVPGLLVVSLLFGFGHSYQGVRGVITTMLVGVVLGLVYLVAGSLLPAMLLHAAGDLHSGTLAYAALSRRNEADLPTPDPNALSTNASVETE